MATKNIKNDFKVCTIELNPGISIEFADCLNKYVFSLTTPLLKIAQCQVSVRKQC